MQSFKELFQTKKLTLIMSLPKNDAEWCRAAFEAGADAVKVHINLHHNAGGEDLGDYQENECIFEKMMGEAKGPMGIVPGASPEAILKDIDKVKSSGFDFVSFYTKHMPVSALPINQTLMAACDAGFRADEIKTYESLEAGVLEASVIPSSEYGSPLTFRDLATYKTIASCTSLPVVVPTQRCIKPEDVPFLAQMGIRGIMIGAIVTGKTLDGIVKAVRAFREAIDAL